MTHEHAQRNILYLLIKCLMSISIDAFKDAQYNCTTTTFIFACVDIVLNACILSNQKDFVHCVFIAPLSLTSVSSR